MKKSKFLVGFLVLVACSLIPMKSSSAATKAAKTSKEDTRPTITLTDDNVIVMSEEVTGESVAVVVEKARELDAKFKVSEKMGGPKRPLYLFLNTPGGSIQAGLELIEQLQALKRPVHTITLFAASMGFQIAQNLGDRLILKNGVLMSHRARGGFEGEFGGQGPSQVDSRYALWLSRLTEMDSETVRRSNGKQTLESYQKAYASEMWRTGTQSVTEGYADKVVKVSCDSSLVGVTTHTIMFMGIIPVSYDLSDCPMNTTPMNIHVGILTNKGQMTLKDFNAKSGGFGYACMQSSVTKPEQVCATDLNLTLERVNQAETEFKSQYEAKMRQVVYMTVGK